MVYAAGGEYSEGIPWGLIIAQLFNVVALIALGIYFLRDKVIAHFKERRANFVQLVSQAETARQEAEKHQREIQGRLAKLESTAEDSVRRAQSEAAEFKAQIIQEAQALSGRLEQEAKLTATYEVERAKAILRQDLLEQALKVAQEDLSKTLGVSEQKKLQSEFVEKIQVVR